DTIVGGQGDDTLSGSDGHDELRGGEGDDLLDGGRNNDLLIGGRGNDVLLGGGAADDLRGYAGDDYLSGGFGPDRLDGNKGDDTLEGGSMEDTFVFRANDGFDTVLDFEDGTDRIDLTALNLTGYGASVSSRVVETSRGVLIDLSETYGLSILLEGVAKADLSNADFLF
ncbi:M10 family metallopeptidase C-terminal domain-containing protein, partial [Mangrovicoccus sp. HB161399]|uniref:M10 family metallopeptidase C-terminal domain-containing protein n=1 Tax=Mangrovicoccus sp. HB161399 TaxID=2720392 RepID=UPI001C12DD59